MSVKKQQVTTNDANTQTIIRVHPHVLEGDEVPNISADQRLQTVLSEKPEDNKHFYSLLKYTPFSDIAGNSLKVVDIPRSKKLQFMSLPSSWKMEDAIRKLTLADDDGVGYACSEILKRTIDHRKVQYFDNGTQTEVTVHPHILEDNDLAVVLQNQETQTGCVGGRGSIRSSKIRSSSR